MIGIGTIRDISNSKAEYRTVGTMPHRNWEHPATKNLEGFRIDRLKCQLRDRPNLYSIPFLKGVVKDTSYSSLNNLRAIQWNRVAEGVGKQSQIVHTVQMVGMFMGIDDGMHHSDIFSQQLISHVGGGIDQQISTGQSEDRARSSPFVLGVIADAYLATASDGRHAEARAGAEQNHLPREFDRFDGPYHCVDFGQGETGRGRRDGNVRTD